MAVNRNRWLWLALGAIVVVLLVLGVAGRGQLPEVAVAQVARENLNATISSNGKVEPITPHDLRAQLTTFVERVLASEGQNVKRGQLLLTLDAAEARARLARAREELLAAEEQLRAARAGGRPDEVAQLDSDLRKTEAELTRLRGEREALERLFAKQAATRDDLDQNKLALERAEAQGQLLHRKKEDMARRAKLDVERATLLAERSRNDVRSLEEKVRSAQVTAPVDGTLYALPVHPGEFVHEGDPLAQLADLRRVRVRAFVDEPDLGWLALGQMVEITWDALPGRVWTGRTEQIPKQVLARGTRSVGELLCSVENQKLELLPNVNVSVRIRVRERPGALVVPRGAVRVEGSQRYVFLVGGGRLHKREIQVGVADALHYEVLAGLAEDDRVALPGDVSLRDGMEVRVVERP